MIMVFFLVIGQDYLYYRYIRQMKNGKTDNQDWY